MASDDFEIRLDRQAIKDLVVSGELRGGLLILAGIAESAAKEYAPVDTGNLRRSITSEVKKELVGGWYARYGTNVEYGLYQELGTRHHPAHPFLRPALEVVRRFLGGR